MQKFEKWMTIPYKAVAVLVLSMSGLGWMGAKLPQVASYSFVANALPAFTQMLAVLLIGNLTLKFAHKHFLLRWLGALFAPAPNKSLGMLLASLFTARWLMMNQWGAAAWDMYLLLYISCSFLIGTSVAVILYHFIGYKAEDRLVSYQVDSSRFDTFMGVVVASVFLGASFHSLPQVQTVKEGASFPLLLAIWSIIATIVSAALVGEKPKESRWWLFSSISVAVLMMVVSAELILSHLPSYWSFNGKEYSASQALLSVELGILVGLIAGIVVRFYDRIADWYVDFLLNKPFMGLGVNISLRIFINILVPFLPTIVVSSGLLISYAVADIYGTAVSLLGMLSNVGVNMVIQSNHLNTKRLPLSSLQRRKLNLVSPELRKILLGFFSKPIGR